MLTPRPSALIFDMDGLMIDSEPLWWSVERALAAAHGKVWTDEMALGCMGTGLENAVRTMQRELALPVEIEAGVVWLVDAFQARIDELSLKVGLPELLAAAEELPLAVASSSGIALIEAVLAHFSLRSRFAAVVSGQSVPNPKPAPDIFLRAASLLDIEPSQCVVLEDSLAGVRAGRAAGMTVIAVPEVSAERYQEATPHVTRDLHQAIALLGY